MAGLGFKDFANGAVADASEVDGYLMHQTIMVFATTTARDFALTGIAADGMVAYTTDTDTLWQYDGSAWRAVKPVTCYNTSETQRNNSTTLTSDSNMTLNIPSAGHWIFEGIVFFRTSAAGDFKMTFVGTGGVSNTELRFGLYSPMLTTYAGLIFGAVSTAFLVSDTGFKHIVVRGAINASGSGTLALQWAQNTSDAGPTNLLHGSWLRAQAAP